MMLTAAIAALLFLTTNQLHFEYPTGVPGLNLVNLVFLAALGLLLLRGGQAPLPAPALRGPLLFYFIAVTLALVISLVARPRLLMEDLTYFKILVSYPLYYFLVYYAVRSPRMAIQLVVVVCVIAVLAALEAWMEARSYGIGVYAETRRAAGPFGPDYRSSNRAGVFYATFLPFFLAIAVFMRGHRLWRMAALGAAFILVGAILFTYSRQAYLIALLTVGLLVWRRGIGTTVLALVLAAALFPFLPEGASERVQETQQQGEYGEERVDESTASRWELWEAGLRMWVEHPAGIGLNRFQAMVGDYSHHTGKDAHNYYVLTFVEAGPLGLLALLLLFWAMFRLAARAVHGASDYQGWALAQGLRLAVLGCLLGNIYGGPFRDGEVMAVLWALLALVERLVQMRGQEVAVAEAAQERLHPTPPAEPVADTHGGVYR
ncbi:MAG: O-antigen ligase family protein [Aquimonas sp.]|nr:O-antigen ligase family protein [Aquimonas sp.]